MHIGFVAHNFICGNGQGRINFEIVRYALANGHQVTLLADTVSPELLTLGANWQRIRQIPSRPNLPGVFVFAMTADRILKKMRSKFDVVVGGGFTLRSAHDVNLCQFVHAAWYRSKVHVSRLATGPRSWYQAAFTLCNAGWERQSYASAGIVVAPSHKIRAELESVGVNPDKIRVIYNGVDPEEFKDFPKFDRASLNLPVGPVMALFVGDIRSPRKNLDSVLRALVQLPDLHLVVLGDLNGSPFPQMARQLGVEKRVHFIGYTLEVKKYMRACDLFVFPSRYEAGTLVLMEAAASGLPIVTAKTAGGCEVFGSDAAEVIDDPDDLAALVRAISRFSDSMEQRQNAGIAARKIALEHTWREMARDYLELFQISRYSDPAPRIKESRLLL